MRAPFAPGTAPQPVEAAPPAAPLSRALIPRLTFPNRPSTPAVPPSALRPARLRRKRDRDAPDAPLPLEAALLAFLRAAAPTAEARAAARGVMDDVRGALAGLGLRVAVFGSWCTGLRIPSSDIDLVATSAGDGPMPRLVAAMEAAFGSKHERRAAFGKALRAVAGNLRTARAFHGIQCIVHAKVPIVKTHHNRHRTKVDISFNRDGLVSSQYICDELRKFRIARGLIMLVKALVANWGLDDPSVGGLGSFPISIMVLWFLREEVETRFPAEYRTNYAVCLVGFLQYYGTQLDYTHKGIDYQNGRLLAKSASAELFVANPLKPHANCAVAASKYTSRVVPKFRETHQIFSRLLEYSTPIPSVERAMRGAFSSSLKALGGDAIFYQTLRQYLSSQHVTSTAPQHQWEESTQFYMGDILGE